MEASIYYYPILTIFVLSNCLTESTGADHKLEVNKLYNKDEEVKEEIFEGANKTYKCEFSMSTEETGQQLILGWFLNGRPMKAMNEARIHTMDTKTKNGAVSLLTLRQVSSASDSGLYECRATFHSDGVDSQKVISRKIRLIIIRLPKWVDDRTEVSGVQGSQVEINCEAQGEPTPDVVIRLASGSSLPERYKENHNVVTIEKVGLEDANVYVLCTATQMPDNFEEIPLRTKKVRVDVYFAPQIRGGETLARFGIPQRNLTIPCEIDASNPPVENFEFSVGGALAFDGNYTTRIDLLNQKAFLDIAQLNDFHFKDEIECKAINKFLSSSQKIKLEKTYPPAIPNVANMGSNDEVSIMWKIEEAQPNPEIRPIKFFRIKHVQIDALGTDRENLENPAWRSAHATECVKKNPPLANLCLITGLRRKTSYVFRFQSVNDAGSSDWSQNVGAVIEKTTSGVPSFHHRFNVVIFLSAMSVIFHNYLKSSIYI